MLAGKRVQRVGDQILREIAVLLLEKVKDPRVRGVTLTGIRLSNDLKEARIFYSFMGDAGELKRIHGGLESAKGFIKREIGLRLALRYVPAITFVHDSSLERASQMEKIFEKLRRDEPKDAPA